MRGLVPGQLAQPSLDQGREIDALRCAGREHGGALAAALGQAEPRAAAGLDDLAVHDDAPAGDVDPIGGERHGLTPALTPAQSRVGAKEDLELTPPHRPASRSGEGWTAAAVGMSASCTSGPRSRVGTSPRRVGQVPAGPRVLAGQQITLVHASGDQRGEHRLGARPTPVASAGLVDGLASCSFRAIGLLALRHTMGRQ